MCICKWRVTGRDLFAFVLPRRFASRNNYLTRSNATSRQRGVEPRHFWGTADGIFGAHWGNRGEGHVGKEGRAQSHSQGLGPGSVIMRTTGSAPKLTEDR